MWKLFTLAAVLMACAGPACAQADGLGGCDRDPETTGALPADPRSLYLPGERPDRVLNRVEMTAPEDSWQEDAQVNSEQRRRDALTCGVD